MRDFETNLPPIPHTAPQLGIDSPLYDENQIYRKTAPASFGTPFESIATKFSSPAITPATFKWNQRLERLIKALGNSGSLSHANQRTFLDTVNDERLFKVVQFDKNWCELMHMIEFAKNLNEKESWNESTLDLSNYSGTRNGFKKHKINPTAQTVNVHAEKKTTPLAPKTPLSGLAPLPGKKPIRVIMAELQRKLHDYKSNSIAWDALQMRVDQYAGIGKVNGENFLRRNRNLAAKFIPVVKKEKTIERIQQQKQHQLQVLQTKKKLEQKVLEKKIKAIKDKERRLAQTLANEKDFLGSLPTIQAKWFSVIFVAVRIKKIQDLLKKKEMDRKKFLAFQHAAIIIQRWYRSFLNAKLQVARKNSLLIIAYHFKVYLKKWRAERLKRASFTVQLFFKEVYDVSKLLKVVKKYRFSVIKAQRVVEDFLIVRKARMIAIEKYWDSIENDWWVQRQKAVRGTELDSADKGKEKKKKATKNKKDEQTNQRISIKLKSKYILENLIIRRKAFLKSWLEEAKGMNGDKFGKTVPLFKLLPRYEEMFEMMDQAFAESKGFK